MSIIVELPGFYEDLTPAYLEKRKAEVDILQTAFVQGNIEHIEKVAHKVAGSGGSYGLPLLSEMGKEIEMVAREGKPEELKELLSKMSDYLKELELIFKD